MIKVARSEGETAKRQRAKKENSSKENVRTMKHQNLQFPQPRPRSIFCRRRNATRTRRHEESRSTIPERATSQIFRDYHSLRGRRDIESQGGRGWKSIGHAWVGEFLHSSALLHPFRLTTTTSFSVSSRSNQITPLPRSWNSCTIGIGMGGMRASSKWRCDDEGSVSLVNLGPTDREGVGGLVVTSHTP